MRQIAIGMIIGLALILSACGADATTAPPASTIAPTDAPTNTPAPTNTLQPDDDAPPTLTFAGLGVEQLPNYSGHLTITFSGTDDAGQPANLTTDLGVNGRQDPFSQLLDMSYTATNVNTAAMGLGSAGQGQIRMLTAGEKVYVTQNMGTANEACVSMPAVGMAAITAALLDPQTLLGTSLPPMQRVEPNEMINNINSRHYRIDNLTNEQFTSGTVDVWVAREGYVSRMIINGSGTFPNMGTGLINVTYDLLATQQTVDYSPQADCSELELPQP